LLPAAPISSTRLRKNWPLRNVREASHPLEHLSPRDVEIMRLLTDGGSLTEIARALGVSYKTVANQRSLLKGKLRVPRTADLVRLALSYVLGRAKDGSWPRCHWTPGDRVSASRRRSAASRKLPAPDRPETMRSAK
jgi:DNA-binding CsgD family transcriptional regulator